MIATHNGRLCARKLHGFPAKCAVLAVFCGPFSELVGRISVPRLWTFSIKDFAKEGRQLKQEIVDSSRQSSKSRDREKIIRRLRQNHLVNTDIRQVLGTPGRASKVINL